MADPADLLPLVFARPKEALAGARAVLDADPSPYAAAIAYQVLGLLERDFGDAGLALAHLRRSVRLARRSGVPERESDALAALGMALVQSGRTAAGIASLRWAAGRAGGHAGARVRFRYAGVRWLIGHHRDALAEIRRALPVLRRAGDVIWTARTITLRGLVHLALGAADRADRDFRVAERLFARTDQEHDRAVAVHNRALAALRAGDLPSALALLDQAERRYRELGTPMPDLDIDYCAALLTAGLDREALDRADAGLVRLEARRGQATRRAELLLVGARAALAAGDPTTAADRAAAACRLFTSQRRDWWSAHGRLLLLQARSAAGGIDRRLVRDAIRCADRLAALGSPDTVPALLLAGRAALAVGLPERAETLLGAAAHGRHRGPALARISGWLAQAVRAEATGDTRRALTACRRGLALLHSYHLSLGAPELRAQATSHGAELAALATRVCLRLGRTRQLLVWSERGRGMALAVPPVQRPPDRRLQAAFTAYREVSHRLATDSGGGAPALRRERHRLERRIRELSRHRPGTRSGFGPERPLDVPGLLAALGDQWLVEIVEIGGRLQVLLCGAGRVRRFPAGSARDAAAEVVHARSALHRLAHGAATRPELALAGLTAAGRRLEAVLLGEAAPYLGDRPVVLVPPGRLYAIPWALLPSLRSRVTSVAPAARAWLRARTAAPLAGGRVLVVCGPGLPAAAAEVTAIAGLYERVAVLDGAAATVERVLSGLDGCGLAHLAVHGTYRADSPLFSALRLADGPLTAYDLERLRRAPHRLVLPSCDSARLAPAGADELLGLTAALLPLGTVGMVASVVPVNDAATSPLMVALHRALSAGRTLAESLLEARQAAAGDPVAAATAWSFLALGAG